MGYSLTTVSFQVFPNAFSVCSLKSFSLSTESFTFSHNRPVLELHDIEILQYTHAHIYIYKHICAHIDFTLSVRVCVCVGVRRISVGVKSNVCECFCHKWLCRFNWLLAINRTGAHCTPTSVCAGVFMCIWVCVWVCVSLAAPAAVAESLNGKASTSYAYR